MADMPDYEIPEEWLMSVQDELHYALGCVYTAAAEAHHPLPVNPVVTTADVPLSTFYKPVRDQIMLATARIVFGDIL